MSTISSLPERMIKGPEGKYEVHRATAIIDFSDNFSNGYAAYSDGQVVQRIKGELTLFIGRDKLTFKGQQLLGPAAALIISSIRVAPVIMVGIDANHCIRGAALIEHRNHPSHWCFF